MKFAGHHGVKLSKKLLSLFPALTFHSLHQYSRRGLRHHAALSFKRNLLHGVPFNLEVDRQMIAAKRVVAFSTMIRMLELAKVSRLLVMVEDYLLVEFA